MLHVHLFFTKVSNETRLEKSAFCFAKKYNNATSIVVALLTSAESESLSPNESLAVVPGFLFASDFLRRQVFYVRKIFSLLNIIYFFFRQLSVIVLCRPSLVSIHNPELLIFTPLLWLFKRINGLKLIYEPHELEVCKTEVKNKSVRRSIIFLLENFSLPVFDLTILVSDSIADFYSDIYGIRNLFVLPNIPLLRRSLVTSDGDSFYKNFSLRKHFLIPDHIPVFIYQGLLAESRGIRDLISVFSSQTNSALVLMGYGPMEAKIVSAAQVYSNIFFLSAVPPEYIVSVTSTADFGIFYIPSSLNPSRSYKYSMPNKFFEYLYSGLPIVSSTNLVDISSLSDLYFLGYNSPPNNTSLAKVIAGISSNYPASKYKFVQSVRDYSSTFSYVDQYDNMMAKLNF